MLDPRDTAMDADKLQQIQTHACAIAALLYDEAALEQLTTLEGIEAAIRGQILEHVSPEIGLFYRNSDRTLNAIGVSFA